MAHGSDVSDSKKNIFPSSLLFSLNRIEMPGNASVLSIQLKRKKRIVVSFFYFAIMFAVAFCSIIVVQIYSASEHRLFPFDSEIQSVHAPIHSCINWNSYKRKIKWTKSGRNHRRSKTIARNIQEVHDFYCVRFVVWRFSDAPHLVAFLYTLCAHFNRLAVDCVSSVAVATSTRHIEAFNL